MYELSFLIITTIGDSQKFVVSKIVCICNTCKFSKSKWQNIYIQIMQLITNSLKLSEL